MSKSVKRVVKNSFFQTFGAFGSSGLTFLLTVAYARFLGPEIYGSLVTSQAQVLVWILLVDLGLSNSLISTLTSAEGGKTDLSRQGFRARDLLFRVLFLRLLGACIGTGAVYLLALHHEAKGTGHFWQEMAFTPHLFALALQQTAMAFASYRNKQGLSVLANLVGVFLTVFLAIALALRHFDVAWLLVAQSWGGFFSAAVVFGYFIFMAHRKRKRGDTRRQLRGRFGSWGPEAWQALARDAWPYAVAFAVFNLWQRLDQLAASRILGLAAGGQYALAVRLVSVPLLVATSVSFAVFPDLQRVGRDAPHRVRLILGALSKVVYRYGILIAALMVMGLGAVVVPLVPKFQPALKLLPHFVPGVWAFWLQSFLMSSLFGVRAYRAVTRAHLLSLLAYVCCVFTLPHFFGLAGVAWAFNIFCLSMCYWGFRAAHVAGLLEKGYLIYAAYSPEERQLLERSGLFFLRRRQEGA